MLQEHKKLSLIKFSLLALVAHIFFLFLLIQYDFKTKEKEQNELSLDFKITNLPAQTAKKASRYKVKKALTKKNPSTPSLNNLMPLKSNWAKTLSKEQTFKASEEVFTENFEDSFFDLLVWEKIDKVIYYPSIFTFFLIEGTFEAEVSLYPNGTLKSLPYVPHQGNKHLERFINHQLKHAFDIPFHKNKWGRKGKVYNYKIKFNFYISYVLGETQEILAVKSENKNLNFYRQSYNINKSPVEKRLPFFMGGGGGGLNLVKTYNTLTGRNKLILKKKEKELQKFYNQNSK